MRKPDLVLLARQFVYHAIEFVLLVGGTTAATAGFGLMFFMPTTSPTSAVIGGGLIGLAAWLFLQWVRRYASKA